MEGFGIKYVYSRNYSCLLMVALIEYTRMLLIQCVIHLLRINVIRFHEFSFISNESVVLVIQVLIGARNVLCSVLSASLLIKLMQPSIKIHNSIKP